ncbi:dTDP-4-dehydro-6-deoxyglucose aminotransferase [Kaistia algarum]|uniref:aminotransferase class I/II-fold pyridoxal phosphate-dependent enzyme n=1 Tax=Kaistia algarum TaxID=2083279 RepID=UPI000CE73279|nr:aminotransferase class I/II-fold pyridoxal phosphate-dependent enzyme [Kaistia algarum]MCX5512705.1 aminotransferase class I/II-fold pyridoxal phosphate-dependent enzyme [Kaistia algarum]PPE81787.1 dTDP-4-dehydro-6-deoxyglucose aminotransferase [Kaistia algarum]
MHKRQLDDLALFGGKPLFGELRHVGRPNIGDRDRFMQRVEEMFDRRWLTNNGPNVVEFEEKIAALTGVPHVIAVCNATIGLELVFRALGLKGEVIVPAFTFVATAHALNWLGIEPVFCDIDPSTHTIDPAAVEKLITPQTTAIVGVHTWGRVCDTEALAEVAGRRGLRLVYDAAHAFACGHDGVMVGSFGDAEVFSFHATKFMNSFEGGAITTRDPVLADRIRRMRNFGFSGLDSVASAGTNGKMTEISAAMGITSLESIDTFISVNKRNYDQYSEAVASVDGLKLYELPLEGLTNYQYVVIEVDKARTGLSRDEITEILFSEGVIARRYFFPGVHNMEPYKSRSAGNAPRLPITDALVGKVLQLPTGTAMSEADIAATTDLLRYIIENHAPIADRLRVRHMAS